MKVILIYNPQSGTTLPLAAVRQKCQQHGIEIKHAIAVEAGFEKRVKKYIKKDQTFIVLGGDGTQSNVANLLVGTEAILAPLAGGTLNHFTKDIGVDQDIDKALENLAKYRPTSVDVATVNGHVFLNNSSIGLYPSSLTVRKHFEDRLGKWPAAVIGSLRAFITYRTYELTISNQTMRSPFIFIGNNNYHLDQPGGGRQLVTEGVLSVYAVDAVNRLSLLSVFIFALIGRLSSAPQIKTWTAKQVTIHAKRDTIRLSRDGELDRVKMPLTYEIKPRALRVLGPSS